MSEEIEYTHRTRDGRKARIICTNRVSVGVYPIVALVCCGITGEEVSVTYTTELRYSRKPEGTSVWDLFEYNPWRDVPIDTPIWVKQLYEPNWYPRHFAGVSPTGRPLAYPSGQTSHSLDDGYSAGFWDMIVLENPNTPTTKD